MVNKVLCIIMTIRTGCLKTGRDPCRNSWYEWKSYSHRTRMNVNIAWGAVVAMHCGWEDNLVWKKRDCGG